MQQLVADDDQVARLGAIDQPLAVMFAIGVRLERRGEAGRFARPVFADARRGDDQRRSAFGAIDQHAERLHRLTQTHVVGQHRTDSPAAEAGEPAVPFDLIIAELCGERFWG